MSIDQKVTSSTVRDPVARIPVKGTFDIPSLDEALASWLETGAKWSDPIILDLSAVMWIEVPALLHLLALVRARVGAQARTLLRVPADKRHRDMLRLWRFPEGIREATGMSFRQLVHPEDHKYFGEAPDSYPNVWWYATPTNVFDRVSSRQFFALINYHVGDRASDSTIVQTEWKRWRSPLIDHMLDHHFPSISQDIARVVVYESIANAIQHPAADTISTVSKLDSSGEQRRSAHLTISTWDSGASIVNTLRTCMASAQSIRAPVRQDVLASRVLVKSLVSNEWQETAVPVSFTPTPTATDEELLLSSFFPGITRKAGVAVPAVPTIRDLSDNKEAVTFEGPGMGLFALLCTVVDQFGGSIAVRTDHYFLNFRATSSSEKEKYLAQYRVKLQRLPEVLPPFLGNMLTVRLPVSR